MNKYLYIKSNRINNYVNFDVPAHSLVIGKHEEIHYEEDLIEDIIIYGLTNGYTFETLNINSPTVHHGINN